MSKILKGFVLIFFLRSQELEIIKCYKCSWEPWCQGTGMQVDSVRPGDRAAQSPGASEAGGGRGGWEH